nr:MAG TPA: hypothetical protein [Caudoviricetes sp.]
MPLPPYKNSILQFYKNVNTFFIKCFYFFQNFKIMVISTKKIYLKYT